MLARSHVPYCLALAMALTGFNILNLAWGLRRLLPDAALATLQVLPRRRRFAGSTLTRYPPATPLDRARGGTLTLRVWLPIGTAEAVWGRPLFDRYTVSVDSKGEASTGHASLELAPDLYISHRPEFIERHMTGLSDKLRATADNDTNGIFTASLGEEIAQWRKADAKVKFRHFNTVQLRAFWDRYRQDRTYSLIDRNCAVAVALALDAALEGSLARRGPWLGFLRLMLDPDLWLAGAIRTRAESATWTPGLLLDYARAMRRLVDLGDTRWSQRFLGMLRQIRQLHRTGRAVIPSRAAPS
jgi:hypothetical protein